VQKASEIALRPSSMVDFTCMCEVELDTENKEFTTLEMPDVKDIRAFLLAGQDIRRDNQIRYTILYQDTAIGFIDMTDVLFEKHSASVGVFLLKKFRGFGFGKQALNLLRIHALEFGILSLNAEVRNSNKESINLFMSAGYDEIEVNELFRRFEFKIHSEAS
jgi:RimJ/RimL family protein N-acetyltransferase